MGKKRKKKHIYTKHEFINICCSKCRICEKGTSPDLCYGEFYKKNPKKFIKKIFKTLLEMKHLIDENTHLQLHDIRLEYIFKKAFCPTNLCGNYVLSTERVYCDQCSNMNDCLEAFKRQIKGQPIIGSYIIPSSSKQKIKKGKKKKHERYVVQAYPSFFTNNSDAFRKEIEEISSDKEQ